MQKPNKKATRTPKTNWLRHLVELASQWWRSFQHLLAENAASSYWRSLSQQHRLFLSNVGVAVLIAVIVASFHQNRWLVRLENSAMDTMMEFNKGLPRMSETGLSGALKFTFLDIDNASYRAWKEPYHTPRDKLLKLIEVAAENNARMIVLDIDLSREGVSADDDQHLAEYLADYGRVDARPPLILLRTFYDNDSGERQWVDIRPSFLDQFEFSPSVYWAQPLFRKTMWDSVVRHWHLVKFGCLNGQLLMLPATQLIAAALLADGNTASVSRSMDLDNVRVDSCSSQFGVNSSRTGQPPGGREEPGSLDPDIGQRLIYTIPWKDPAPDLVTISAQLITESDREFSDDLIANRIVVIGASFSESGDIHRTPIGEMPGALIIANAIKSLALYGQVREPSAWAQWILKLTLIFLTAWAFSRFTSLTAVGVAGAVIIGTLVPISFYFFKYGVWLDFAIPLFGMMMSRAVAEYRGSRIRSRAVAR